MPATILTIGKTKDDFYTCHKTSESGDYIQGIGVSVLEAIGSWAFYNDIVIVRDFPDTAANDMSVAPVLTESHRKIIVE